MIDTEAKEIGKTYVFHTTHSDMMNMNGAKCVIVGKDELNGLYRVKFIDHTLTVFPEEIGEEINE